MQVETSSKIDSQLATVEIQDPRIDALQELLKSPKVIYSKITIMDAAGFKETQGRAGLAPALLNLLASMEALVHVARAFRLPQVESSIDPQRDIADMHSDFLIHDMEIVERRLLRLVEERGKGAGDPVEIEREKLLLGRLLESLEKEIALRMVTISTDELRMLSGYGLMSLKPLLIVLNTDEQYSAEEFEEIYGARVLSLNAKLEWDISTLAQDEATIFLAEYAIEIPGRERFLEAARELLGIISFFTFNEKELRAWALKKGSSALDAAGVIHTDLARGFIRAEIISWDDLIELRGIGKARAAGKLRVEGKDYQVKDGELITIRFNI